MNEINYVVNENDSEYYICRNAQSYLLSSEKKSQHESSGALQEVVVCECGGGCSAD